MVNKTTNNICVNLKLTFICTQVFALNVLTQDIHVFGDNGVVLFTECLLYGIPMNVFY